MGCCESGVWGVRSGVLFWGVGVVGVWCVVEVCTCCNHDGDVDHIINYNFP